MSELRHVVSKEGLRGSVASDVSSDTRHVTVHFENGRTMRVPVEALQRDANGLHRLTVSMADLEQVTSEAGHDGRVVVPVIEESVEVEQRRVHTGTVRVHKRVSEHEETIDAALLREDVHVERVPMDQVVTKPPQSRQEGDTLIIPVVEEVLVVEKRLMLKEEVHITRRRTEEQTSTPVRLRSEEVVVERTPTGEHDNSPREREV